MTSPKSETDFAPEMAGTNEVSRRTFLLSSASTLGLFSLGLTVASLRSGWILWPGDIDAS